MVEFIWWIPMIIVVAALVFGLAWLQSRPKVQRQCRHCSAQMLLEIGRETLQSRTAEVVGGGAMAGGDVRLQLDQEVSYRCQSCGKVSKFQVTTTN